MSLSTTEVLDWLCWQWVACGWSCTWVLHSSLGSGYTRVFFSFRMGTCTDPWNLFSSEQVMVTILVTLVLSNLYLVLHYNVGSGLTRVFRFTTLGNWAACFNTGLMNSFSSALVTVSSNLLLVTFHSNTSSTRVLSVGWWNFSTSSFFYLISSSRVHN